MSMSTSPGGWSHRTNLLAEETAYPPKLAQAIAHSFTKALAADGWNLPDSDWVEMKPQPSFAAMRAVAGRQPKASKVPPLVSEHKIILSVLGPIDLLHKPPCPTMARIKSPWVYPTGFNNSHIHKLGQQGIKTWQSQNWFGVFLGVATILWKRRWPEATHVLLIP